MDFKRNQNLIKFVANSGVAVKLEMDENHHQNNLKGM
jgi:hypothetical protein